MRKFICIDSNGGRVGRICWLNSKTMPHWDPLCCRMIRRWGGWGFDPDPACYLNGMDTEVA